MAEQERRLRQAHALLAKHRCRAVRFGRGWRVTGPNIDVLIADLALLTRNDLVPVRRPAD